MDNQDRELFGQTPWQTVGPFFHYGLPWKGGADLTGNSELGARTDLFAPEHYLLRSPSPRGPIEGVSIEIAGRVLDGDGKPVPDALVEIWQADAAGQYFAPGSGRNFIGFGRAATGNDGEYRFRTILPGRVPGPGNSLQAPHIAVGVMARGLLKRLVTRIYFPDGEGLDTDPILELVPPERRDTLIARKENSGYRFDITLQGTGETVFLIAETMSRLIRDLSSGSAEMLEIFGDAAFVKHALAFEAALAEAEAAEGLLTADEAARIVIACAQLPLDTETLAVEAAHAGTFAIPLIHHLRQSLGDDALAKKIHYGATSQDVADTVLMMQAKAGSALIAQTSARLQTALASLAERTASVPMTGRTLLQDALPISFGLKAAQWLAGIDEASSRFAHESEQGLMLQFGGAAGSRAGLNGKGIAVAVHMAKTLGLLSPLLPWHARRGHVAGLASALAIVIGAAAKIARDISLLAQNEIGEAFEPRVQGRGGSSAMAHKRNPTGCQIVLSAAARTPNLAATIVAAMPQEQERGLGGWQAEASVLADLFVLTHGALSALAPVIEGLVLDTARMTANLAAANIGSDIGESEALVRAVLKARL